ncbi:MAG: YceI family protein [Leadbetterella sp.]|nr:YceI family protein [Leadbetterella sp.]
MKKTILLFLAGVLTLSAATFASLWKPADYTIKFSTSKASGTIGGLEGVIDFEDPATSRFDVTVDLSTLDMGLGLKTKHAKQENFFDAEKYPTIRFRSSEITRQGAQYLTKGELTIKGISRPVSIPFTFTKTGSEGLFNGSFEVNRKDFNLERKGVGEVVKVELNIPVNK